MMAQNLVPHTEEPIDFFGTGTVQDLNGNARLASGAFGEITLAIHKDRVAVVKTIYSSDARHCEVKQELSALKLLCPHPHIVDLLAVYPDRTDFGPSTAISLAFSYCPVDLYLVLEWKRRTFAPLISFDVIKVILKDIFSALKHCHEHDIVHLDVKCGNLLVSSRGFAQLCDFGLARRSECTATPRGLTTLHYRPPEILLGASGESSADIYSAGIVLAELVSGRTPFRGRNVLGQLQTIFDALGTPSASNSLVNTPDFGKIHFLSCDPVPLQKLIPRAAESEHLLDLLKSLLALDPNDRLSSGQALEHEWLSKGLADRSAVILQIIPPELDEPFLATPDRALQLAAVRREFLSNVSAASKKLLQSD
jgi:serine/threonine protein kinase